MRLLLDTHIFLWALKDDPKLPKSAQAMILEATEVFVSAASIWEIAIKLQNGKLEVDLLALLQAIPESGFHELTITARHAMGVRDLPPHHKDPFDRLLISQALAEPLRLLTSDPILCKYTDLVIEV